MFYPILHTNKSQNHKCTKKANAKGMQNKTDLSQTGGKTFFMFN